VGNYELNGLEILGYFLFVCGLLGLSLAKHELSETHKYISIGLGLSGLAVGLCGNIKNGRDKNKN
jgi:hypothetical protein